MVVLDLGRRAGREFFGTEEGMDSALLVSTLALSLESFAAHRFVFSRRLRVQVSHDLEACVVVGGEHEVIQRPRVF